MRVLIIGVNGFVGQATARYAESRGLEVFGVGRSACASSNGSFTYIPADRQDPEQLLQLVKDHQIDVVVDVIAMVSDDTQPLLDCLDGEVTQYVMISSADVYEVYDLLHRRGGDKETPLEVTEASPLRTSLYPYRGDAPRSQDSPEKTLDDYDKIPIENAVQNLTSAWTILRLPMVFGPGDSQRRFRWAIEPMLRNERTITIPRVWAGWTSTYGYIDNVGSAIAATLGDPSAFQQIFNVAEEQPVSQLDWLKKFATVANWSGEIELTNDPDDPFQQQLSGLNLDVPLRISGARLRQVLGYSDVVDAVSALERTFGSEASENEI